MDDRVWVSCTKWTGDKAKKLVRQAAKILCDLGYDLSLNKNVHSGLGTEQLNGDGSISHEVGIKEISEHPRRRFSIHEALAPTVACFHEVCGHGGQWRHEAQKDEPLSKVLLLNDIACKSSSRYYGVDSGYTNAEPQYFEQPHEIAAQYMGLKMTQKFLTVLYGEEKADKWLCEYVNLRIASGNEFIKAPDGYRMEIPADGREPYMKPTEPFTSMDRIYDAFQKTFVKQVFCPVDYTVTKNFMDYAEYYIENKNWPWERKQSRNQINQISDRITQTYVLSAIWLHQHEYGQWIRDLPVFEHMEFPDTIPRLIKNAPDDPNKADLDLHRLTEDGINFVQAVEQLSEEPNQSLHIMV